MKTAGWLLLLAIALLLATFGHGMMSHTLLPQPDPTPEEAAHEAFHHPIGMTLFLATVVMFLAAILAGVVAVVEWLVRLARGRG